MEKICLLSCALSILIGISLSTEELDWWENGYLYQIYPRSFKDGDGDGTGDLKGITKNLTYLKDIGMDGAWLSPVFKSPMSDFGYDISDFFDIDPIYGNLEDFDALIAKAKKIDLKMILDFVPNHSSDECEWFQKSIDRVDGYEDFYVWADGKDDPENPGSKIPPSNWNNDFGGKAWTWNDKRKQYYLHQFQSKQPDINFRDPKARETMLDVLKFWLDRGVDGFRTDSVPYLFEVVNEDGTYSDEPVSGKTNDTHSNQYYDHIYTRDLDENAELLAEWRKFIDDYQKTNGGPKKAFFVEAYSPIEAISKYYGNATNPAAHFAFNFNLMNLNETSTARDLEREINAWMDVIWKDHKSANWVLGNHDNPRVCTRMGKEKIDLMNIIVAAMPGLAVIYNGEEIGMCNVDTGCASTCDFRDGERTPLQWNSAISAGFSTSNKTWLPVSDDYKTLNIEAQLGVDRSSLEIFKQLNKLKKTNAFKAIEDVDAWSYGADSDNLFRIERKFNSIVEYLILVNLGSNDEVFEPLCNSADENECFMKYIIVTKYSPHNIGDKADLNKIQMKPYEAVVLKRITNEEQN